MKKSARVKLIYCAVSVSVAAIVLGVVFFKGATVWASWYGPHFHGRRTANGEIFNMYDLTAASRSMPFGTVLKVTNCDNKKSVCVRVNDRGPYKMDSRGEPVFPLRAHPYRDLDLSYAAARRLGMIWQGVARVSIQVVSSLPAGEEDGKS